MFITVGSQWVDPGWICTTSTGANCNDYVQVTGTVDTSTIGTYSIRYSYTQPNHPRPVEASRTVRVAPPVQPVVFTLSGASDMRVFLEQRWVDPGYRCIDSNGDPCPTNSVTISNYPNTSQAGVYYMEYKYFDVRTGRTYTLYRTVRVGTYPAILLGNSQYMTLTR